MTDRLSVVIPAYNEADYISGTLDALAVQTQRPEHVVVVDNNSTDETAEIVGSQYPWVQLVREEVKGTGVAADTGFRYAIDNNGSGIVLRTDADAVPTPTWIEAAVKYLDSKPKKLLVGGLNMPREDKYYKWYDPVLMPLGYHGYRVLASAVRRSLHHTKLVRGLNMAIRSDTYDEVGGFPHTSIEDVDEDLELTRRVCELAGVTAVGRCRDMVVEESMRRIRAIGYRGAIRYYLNQTDKPNAEIRIEATNGQIDIR